MENFTIPWKISDGIVTFVTIICLTLGWGVIGWFGGSATMAYITAALLLVFSFALVRMMFFKPTYTEIDLATRTVIQHFRTFCFRQRISCYSLVRFGSVKSYIYVRGKLNVHCLVLASTSGNEELKLCEFCPKTAFNVTYDYKIFDTAEYKQLREIVATRTNLHNAGFDGIHDVVGKAIKPDPVNIR